MHVTFVLWWMDYFVIFVFVMTDFLSGHPLAFCRSESSDVVTGGTTLHHCAIGTPAHSIPGLPALPSRDPARSPGLMGRGGARAAVVITCTLFCPACPPRVVMSKFWSCQVFCCYTEPQSEARRPSAFGASRRRLLAVALL